MTEKIIFGIDPGFDRVGWAVGRAVNRKLELLDYGCIQTNNKQNIFARYEQIFSELNTLVSRYQPNQLAIETLYFSKNTTSAIRVSEARGIIISSFLEKKIDILELNPGTIKLAVAGNGRANKKELDKMVRLQVTFPHQDSMIDDAIDAVAIALTAAVS